MKKPVILFLSFILSATISFAEGIVFEKGTWVEVQAKAKEENKFIFVDCYTTWCGPCKMMTAQVFPLDDVGEFFNENFISYKLDMEKGEGKEFAKKHKIRAYPTLLFFDPNGTAVHKLLGAMMGDELIANSKDALDVEKQSYALQKKYDDGDRSLDFLHTYIMLGGKSGLDTKEALITYWAKVPDEEKTNEKNWKLLKATTRDFGSDQFKFILKNRSELIEKYGKEDYNFVVNNVLDDLIFMSLIKDKLTADEFKTKVEKDFADMSDKLTAKFKFIGWDMKAYNAKKNGEELDNEARHKDFKLYLEKYADGWHDFNQSAWTYFETVDDKEMLEEAVKWASRSIELEENFFNTDTKANLLVKLERYKEALPLAKKSVELGKANGEDVKAGEELIEKIEKKIN